MNVPFFVAEIGASHNGSLETALELVKAAKRAGANAIKLQTWSEMTVADYTIPDGLWKGRKLGQLYREAETPWSWHEPVFDLARSLGMEAFSTPFDFESVDFLEKLGVDKYKIASFEITDLSLIKYAAAKGKHMILSTGMAAMCEIQNALDVVWAHGSNGITLLHCVSAYPAPLIEMRLGNVRELALNWPEISVGLSDHSKGSLAAQFATAYGATMIEKHIGLFSQRGLDGDFSADEYAFSAMVEACNLAAMMCNDGFWPSISEMPSLQFRRSLWVVRDMLPGDTITLETVRALRPLGGLPAQDLMRYVGAEVTRVVRRGEPLTADCVKDAGKIILDRG